MTRRSARSASPSCSRTATSGSPAPTAHAWSDWSSPARDMPSVVEQRDDLTRFGVPIEGFRHPAPDILESWSDRLSRGSSDTQASATCWSSCHQRSRPRHRRGRQHGLRAAAPRHHRQGAEPRRPAPRRRRGRALTGAPTLGRRGGVRRRTESRLTRRHTEEQRIARRLLPRQVALREVRIAEHQVTEFVPVARPALCRRRDRHGAVRDERHHQQREIPLACARSRPSIPPHPTRVPVLRRHSPRQ
jgi:hypothetical protein